MSEYATDDPSVPPLTRAQQLAALEAALELAVLGPNPPPLRSGSVVREGAFRWYVHRKEGMAEGWATVHRSAWTAHRALRLWIASGRHIGRLA
jgi:hypothetical protein